MKKEDFKDKIKPPAPPEFEIGSRITPEALAAYIDKPNLNPENFGSSGRSKRVGHYMLDRQRCTTLENLDKTFIRFVLSNYSHQGECTENGIIDCRQYVFIEYRGWRRLVYGARLKCESYNNSMLGFYDQMTLDGNSIHITI